MSGRQSSLKSHDEFRNGPVVVSIDDDADVSASLTAYFRAHSKEHALRLDQGTNRRTRVPTTSNARLVREGDTGIFDLVPIHSHGSTSRGEFLTLVEELSPDIVLIDLKLQPGSPSVLQGLDLISEVYQTSEAGIVVYSSEEELTYGQECYERGADDFVHKAVEGTALLRNRVVRLWRGICEQRSRLALRTPGEGLLILGKWTVDTRSRVARATHGEAIRLSVMEHAFLSFFSKHPSGTLDAATFEAFFSPPDVTPTSQKMASLVSRIRGKLGNIPLRSSPDGGYCIHGDQ